MKRHSRIGDNALYVPGAKKESIIGVGRGKSKVYDFP